VMAAAVATGGNIAGLAHSNKRSFK
jgi:hypothetical protein